MIKMKEEQSNNLLGMSTNTHYNNENETADSGVFDPRIIKSTSRDSASVASGSTEKTGKKKNYRKEKPIGRIILYKQMMN